MREKSQYWHSADIKSALEKKGITLRELSRIAGLSPDSLRNVFVRSWPRAEWIIANALETTPDVIWPSRYLSNDEEPHPHSKE